MNRIIEQTDKQALTIHRYFDVNGKELHMYDTVLDNGVKRTVYLTKAGELGIDATNPTWIEKGLAGIGEYGIYPFTEEMLSHIEKI